MSLTEHITELAGKPVVTFDPQAPFDFGASVPRLSLDWEAHVDGRGMSDILGDILRRPDVGRVEGLVFGPWDFLSSINSSVIVDALVAAKDRLPLLRAVFLGDILDGEQELAWIAQSDVTPLAAAFPRLESLRIRGSAGLSLTGLAHPNLCSLVVESAGLSADVVRAVLGAKLPALEELELWIGSESQGATLAIEEWAPLFTDEHFPALRRLALRNAENADALAAAIATAPILSRLKKLDLSLGTLSDTGAEALLASPAVAQLEDLDVRKSYISPEIIKRFHALVPVIVDIRGSRFGKEEGAPRPSTIPPKREFELPLARMRRKSRRRA